MKGMLQTLRRECWLERQKSRNAEPTELANLAQEAMTRRRGLVQAIMTSEREHARMPDPRDRWANEDGIRRRISEITGWKLRRIAGVRVHLRTRREALRITTLPAESRPEEVSSRMTIAEDGKLQVSQDPDARVVSDRAWTGITVFLKPYHQKSERHLKSKELQKSEAKDDNDLTEKIDDDEVVPEAGAFMISAVAVLSFCCGRWSYCPRPEVPTQERRQSTPTSPEEPPRTTAERPGPVREEPAREEVAPRSSPPIPSTTTRVSRTSAEASTPRTTTRTTTGGESWTATDREKLEEMKRSASLLPCSHCGRHARPDVSGSNQHILRVKCSACGQIRSKARTGGAEEGRP